MPAGLGWIGLWWRFRQQKSVPHDVAFPVGTGPLLILCSARPNRAALTQVRAILEKRRPDMRIFDASAEDMPDPETDLEAMRHLVKQAQPFAVLLLGAELPAALIISAAEMGIPVIMGEARFHKSEASWRLRAAMRRELLSKIKMFFVTDTDSHHIARRVGIAARQVSMTGPVAEIHDPLPCNENERSAIAELLGGRHSWLAVCIPPSEEDAILAAHMSALHQSHRALLFLVLTDMDRIGPLAEKLERNGLIVARRDLEQEPDEEVQVMIADSTAELGLWYRIAPVTYIGGTLSGDDELTRHPFEPAALGSAVVHGPFTRRFPTEWQQLDGANASRLVPDAEALASSIAELTQPDIVADLASNAWTVSTGGAGVAMQIASAVLTALEEAEG